LGKSNKIWESLNRFEQNQNLVSSGVTKSLSQEGKAWRGAH